mgnify:FL=1
MKFKKIVSVIVGAAMILGAVGCGNSAAENTTQENTEAVSEGSGTRTIVDHTGAEVEIPETLDRIVISSTLPLPSVYCFFRGSSEGLIGIHPSSMAAAENSYLTTVYPEITELDTSFVENGEINVEQLMQLEPDVVFYSAANTDEREMYDNAGIKAVGFSTTLSDYNTIETFANWIDLLGQIFGESEKAQEIIEYGRSVETEILEKTSALKDEEKPKVLVLFNYGDGTITTSGSNFFGQYWIESAGGINVAEELSGQAEINMEQIYAWNPDIIFITNFSSVLPEDLYNNAIEGNDWSQVSAVQNKQVYKFPLGMYRWFPPSSDTPLALMWLAKTIQPEVFEYIDMDGEIKDYYAKYYNVELTDSDIQTIYNPAREAAGN